MIRFCFLFLLIIVPVIAAAKKPDSVDTQGHQGTLRTFYKLQKFNFMMEFETLHDQSRDSQKHLMIGTKYRISRHLKLGVYSGIEYGNRHDEDWIKGPWRWRETGDRSELFTVLEGLYRFLLPFDSLFELRGRYTYNYRFRESRFLLRPGLRMRVWPTHQLGGTLVLQHEWEYALNFSDKSLVESWSYLSFLIDVSSWGAIGPQFSYGQSYWTSSPDYKSVFNDSYENKENSFRTGLLLNLYF